MERGERLAERGGQEGGGVESWRDKGERGWVGEREGERAEDNTGERREVEREEREKGREPKRG